MAKPSIIRFSPGDWTSDLGIQALSYFERGIWFEILLKMHASLEIGKLMLTPGKAVPDSIIASKILKIDPGEWDKVKAVLLEYGVASICPATGALIAPGSIPRSLLRAFNFEIWKLKCLGACPEDLYFRNILIMK